ncbi:ABC transporter permease [Gleimia europaea]|uniref:ABC transporter permease n=1 Tax=Gleimia europaea TaxID=66228 RepID=UPI00265848F0|nr:ABC transporter permease [Gleimia europaea]MDK7142370.1 ABC transporter permease [Gleimia europaea]
MQFWTQAGLAVKRHPKKSVTLAGIIFVISAVFILQGIVSATVNTVTNAATERIAPGFTVTSTAGDFQEEAAQQLLDYDRLTGHNFVLHTAAEAEQLGFVSVTGASDVSKLPTFAEEDAQIDETSLQKLQGSQSIIMPELIAEQLGIKAGDKLTLGKDSSEVELEVAGVYKQDISGSKNPDVSVYASLETAQKLAGKTAVSSATYLTKAEDVDHAIKFAKEHAAQGLEVASNTGGAADLLGSVSGFATLLLRLLRVILVSGGLILAFVLAFFVRSRIHEIGILLTIGFSKLRIFAQVVTELIMLTVPAFIVALIASEIAGHFLSAQILQSATDGQISAVPLGALSTSAIAAFGGIIAIVLVALLIAILPILRLPPKRILAKMS